MCVRAGFFSAEIYDGWSDAGEDVDSSVIVPVDLRV
jgi:hypothetical protein